MTETTRPRCIRTLTLDQRSRVGRGEAHRAPSRPHDFDLQRWSSITFVGARKKPGRLLFDFTGVVECEPIGNGTRVRHACAFRFKGPLKFIERANAEWLQRELDAEMAAIVEKLGTPATPLAR